MQILSHATFAAAAMLVTATPSEACRAHRSPEQRLAGGCKSGAISSVALVRISGAEYTAAQMGDAHPWRASATIVRVVQGSYSGKTVRFDRGNGTSMCDDGLPPPAVGEAWVVYFWKSTKTDEAVWVSYSAKVAYAADPLLADEPAS